MLVARRKSWHSHAILVHGKVIWKTASPDHQSTYDTSHQFTHNEPRTMQRSRRMSEPTSLMSPTTMKTVNKRNRIEEEKKKTEIKRISPFSLFSSLFFIFRSFISIVVLGRLLAGCKSNGKGDEARDNFFLLHFCHEIERKKKYPMSLRFSSLLLLLGTEQNRIDFCLFSFVSFLRKNA